MPKLALALLFIATPALAADHPIVVKPRPKAACVWVTDCQACTRGADGKLACSNPGIACQPKMRKCVSP